MSGQFLASAQALAEPTSPPAVELEHADLIVALVLSGCCAELDELLLAGLQALEAGRGSRSLLVTLRLSGELGAEAAEWGREQLEALQRRRALAICWELAHERLPAAQLARLICERGSHRHAAGVLASFVAEGVLDLEGARALEAEARRVFRQQGRELVQAYRRTPWPEEDPLRRVHRALAHRLDPADTPGASTALCTTVRPARSSPAPGFAVPAWIEPARPDELRFVPPTYCVLGRIGTGAMGTVLLAFQQDDPTRPIALKSLHEGLDESARGRFQREILAQGLISHPHVLELIDAGDCAGRMYLGMEFFDGPDLAQVLEECGQLDPRAAIRLGIQLFSALAGVHEAGVVHRDLKPANVLVSRGLARCKLTDFGIAILPGIEELSAVELFSTLGGGGQVSAVPGTARYASPEAALGEAHLGPASDLYSLGLVLYEMLAGCSPWESRTAVGFLTSHIVEPPVPLIERAPATAALPEDLHALLGELLQKSPARRPAGALAVVSRLERIADLPEAPQGAAPSAPRPARPRAQPPSPPPPGRGWLQRVRRGLRSLVSPRAAPLS